MTTANNGYTLVGTDSEEEDECDESLEELGYLERLVAAIGAELEEHVRCWPTLVLIFDKESKFDGELEEDVPDSEDLMQEIFHWQTNDVDRKTPRESRATNVSTMRTFQNKARWKIVHTLVNSGLNVEHFNSYDDDEVFLKVALKQDGPVARHLAYEYMYRVPLNDDAYTRIDREVQVNYDGDPVYAYVSYQLSMPNKLQEFREIDIIRLMMRRLSECFDLDQLQQKGVICGYFVAADRAVQQHLEKTFAKLGSCGFPCAAESEGRIGANLETVRDYFGEEIAFFFEFFAFYIHRLVPIAICSAMVSLVEIPFFHISYYVENPCKICFGIVLILWTTGFLVEYKHKQTRAMQRWGMEHFDPSFDVVLSSYEPELDGSWAVTFREVIMRVCMLLYCLLFVVAGIASDSVPGYYGTLVNVSCIKIFSFVWGWAADWLVSKQNHRTQQNYDNELTMVLVLVKLFLYLYPFVQIAFIQVYTHRICRNNLEDLANAAFGEGTAGWPSGVDPNLYKEWLPEYTFREQEGSFFWTHPENMVIDQNQICAWGCLPRKCDQDEGQNTASCLTDCYFDLRNSLDALYFTHIASTFFFLVVPYLYLTYVVRSEIKKESTEKGKRYRALEIQAKQNIYTPYKYLSFGGSYVEDFIEVLLGFALLSCFGIVRPILGFFALVSQAIEYKLLAYRMTNLTCRPYPKGSRGIGQWDKFMEATGTLSLLTNSGLVAFCMRPMDRWRTQAKVFLFFVIVVFRTFSRVFLQIMLPEESKDVRRIRDFNADVVRRTMRGDALMVPEDERCKANDVQAMNALKLPES